MEIHAKPAQVLFSSDPSQNSFRPVSSSNTLFPSKSQHFALRKRPHPSESQQSMDLAARRNTDRTTVPKTSERTTGPQHDLPRFFYVLLASPQSGLFSFLFPERESRFGSLEVQFCRSPPMTYMARASQGAGCRTPRARPWSAVEMVIEHVFVDSRLLSTW